MKITKTSFEIKMEKEKYLAAHDGCSRCPCCEFPIIKVSDYKEYTKGWFRPRRWRIDKYKCGACSTEFQSDPFEIPIDKIEKGNRIWFAVFCSVCAAIVAGAIIMFSTL